MAVFIHAVFATKVDKPEQVEGCNERLTAVREQLMHGPSASVVSPWSTMTSEAYAASRTDALEVMRSACRVCGMCARIGLQAP